MESIIIIKIKMLYMLLEFDNIMKNVLVGIPRAGDAAPIAGRPIKIARRF